MRGSLRNSREESRVRSIEGLTAIESRVKSVKSRLRVAASHARRGETLFSFAENTVKDIRSRDSIGEKVKMETWRASYFLPPYCDSECVEEYRVSNFHCIDGAFVYV